MYWTWASLARQCYKQWHMQLIRMIYWVTKLEEVLHQKYYKGVLNPLYFPYVNHDLKTCHHVKVPYYFGLHCSKVYLDEFMLDTLKTQHHVTAGIDVANTQYILDTNDCHDKWEKNNGERSLYKTIMEYFEK